MGEINIKDAKCTGLSLQVPICFDSQQTKTADFVIEAYTGQTVDRWWGKLAIGVDGIKAKKQIPIFRDHMRNAIVGYSQKTWTDGSFFVSGKFSEVTESAQEVRGLAAEGFPWQASIGVRPLRVMAIKEGSKQDVNGKSLKGPAEIWLESEVFETSFVPLGADDGTSVSVFSRFEEAEQPTDAGQPAERTTDMGEKQEAPAVLTVEVLRADHPGIVNELLAEGARGERERIQAVEAQGMPGHEDLIAGLKFDGRTTGPEAAVAVLAAEKQIRENAAQDLADDGEKPVDAVTPPDVVEEPGKLADDAPVEERAKAEWDEDAKLRSEFGGDYDAYLAYRQNEQHVKSIGHKEG